VCIHNPHSEYCLASPAEQLYHSALYQLSNIRSSRTHQTSTSTSLFAPSSYTYLFDLIQDSNRFPLAHIVRLFRRIFPRSSASSGSSWSILRLLSKLKSYGGLRSDRSGKSNLNEAEATEGVNKAVRLLEEAGRKGKIESYGVLGDIWLVSFFLDF
jgi:hypothetical protein